jgi:antirestriction protein
MTALYAQPYDISADGFYFETAAEYHVKARKAKNGYGLPVEEFEIQFIDGADIDANLFEALKIHQGNFAAFLEATEEWGDDEKIKIIVAVGEAGYAFNLGKDDPQQFDVDLYELNSLSDLAMQFVEDGLFGTITEPIQYYLDYDAIARDLGMDYTEISIAGTSYIYRCS